MGLSEEQLQIEIEKEEKKIVDVTAEYDKKLKELENKYEEVMAAQEEAVANIKSGALAVYKSVQVSGKATYQEILKALLLKKQSELNKNA